MHIATMLMVSIIYQINRFVQTAADFWLSLFSMLQLWNLQTLAAQVFGGQTTLFSTKLLLDTGWKWYLLQFSIPLPAPEALAGEFVCSLGLLQEKREPFINPGFRVSLCFFLPPRVLLLALQPYCKCSMCGLFANTVYLRD